MNRHQFPKGTASAGVPPPESTARPRLPCPLATPNHPSDGGLIRGEAATIASPQVAPVDVSSAPYPMTRTYAGVSDRSRLRRLAYALRAMWPERLGGIAVLTECAGPKRARL